MSYTLNVNIHFVQYDKKFKSFLNYRKFSVYSVFITEGYISAIQDDITVIPRDFSLKPCVGGEVDDGSGRGRRRPAQLRGVQVQHRRQLYARHVNQHL